MPYRLSYSWLSSNSGELFTRTVLATPLQMAFNLSLRLILLLRVSSSLFSYILTCSNLRFRFDLPYFIYNVCEMVTKWRPPPPFHSHHSVTLVRGSDCEMTDHHVISCHRTVHKCNMAVGLVCVCVCSNCTPFTPIGPFVCCCFFLSFTCEVFIPCPSPTSRVYCHFKYCSSHFVCTSQRFLHVNFCSFSFLWLITLFSSQEKKIAEVCPLNAHAMVKII